MISILLVSVDSVLRQALAEQLRRDGEFGVTVAASVRDGRELARATPFDAIILDLEEPDGLAVLEDAPGGAVLLLLEPPGAASEISASLARDGGAQRIARPFRLKDLLARLRAVPPRASEGNNTDGACLQAGPWRLYKAAKTLRHSGFGVAVPLTEKETEILACLFRACGETVRRDRLLSEVWGYGAAVATHTVETHVYRLRQKVGAAAADGEGLIVTRPEGYALRAGTDTGPDAETGAVPSTGLARE